MAPSRRSCGGASHAPASPLKGCLTSLLIQLMPLIQACQCEMRCLICKRVLVLARAAIQCFADISPGHPAHQTNVLQFSRPKFIVKVPHLQEGCPC